METAGQGQQLCHPWEDAQQLAASGGVPLFLSGGCQQGVPGAEDKEALARSMWYAQQNNAVAPRR
eukprot:COSAG01_NODE_50907_length_359_cov_0.788462_2_plen_65_part_01